MRVLFIHNDKIKKDSSGNLYTGGCYNDNVWRRYHSLSKDFTVMLKQESRIYEEAEAAEKFNYFDKERIKFVALPNLYHSVKDFFNVKNRKNIISLVEDEVKKNDLIIIRSVASLACKKAIQFAVKYHKPYVIEITGVAWRSLWFHSLRGKILAPYTEYGVRRYVKKAPYAVYVTNETLQKLYPCKGKTIGVSDVEIQAPGQEVLEKRINKIENGDGKVILGTIANVNVKSKGHKFVFQAISRLKKKGYEYEYQMVGGGDSSYLEGIADKYGVRENIRFLGAIPHEEIFNWLDKIDVYIQPSLQEGLPRAVVEALSRACPCIGSRTGGTPELLNSRYVFRNYRVKELCGCLERMDQSEMKKEAKRSCEKAYEYRKEYLDEKRRKFYDELVAENDLERKDEN